MIAEYLADGDYVTPDELAFDFDFPDAEFWEFCESSPGDGPVIPDVIGLDNADAALRYADAGLFVLPVNPRQPKNPGSVVGKRWDKKSSPDRVQVELWWANRPDSSIAIHTGPSGLVGFDLDIDVLPEELSWLKSARAQLSRPGGDRGMYLFATDETFVSGRFRLRDGTQVGEIRSGNSVFIAAPSRHAKADSGAAYRWPEVGPVPELPDVARGYLRTLTARAGEVSADSETVAAFLAGTAGHDDRPRALDNLTGALARCEAGTRDRLRNGLRIAAGEARIGFYAYQRAVTELESAARASYARRAASGDPVSFEGNVGGPGELARLVANGVGWALGRSVDDLRAEFGRDYGTDSRTDARAGSVSETHSATTEFSGNGAAWFGDWLADGDRAADPERETEIRRELARLEIRAEARQRFDSGALKPLDRKPKSLTEFLSEPASDTPMRIEKLMPEGGRVIFSAPYKAGKTTTVGNLIRSLVDGDPFLDTFPVHKRAKRLVLIDNELSENMVRSWLSDQGIKNTDAVVDVICLRGEVSSFDLLNPVRRSEWSKLLRDLDGDYVIFDCLRPVLDALGLDENHDAGKFLTAFDELLKESGSDGDALIVHHMGHANERARGDSRIQDWPDAIWKIVREDPDNDFSPRYFSATGRDVEVPQGSLKYDAETRRLAYRGQSKTEAKEQRKSDAAVSAILKVLKADRESGGEGLGQNQIVERAMKESGVTQKAAREAVKRGEETGELTRRSGKRNAHIYTLSPMLTGDSGTELEP